MFLESSRYFNLKTAQAESAEGRTVQAVTLRRLPYVEGTPTEIKGNDRLDVIAQRRYSDPTRFWYIGDANTELRANDLIKERPNSNEARIINVPEK